MEELPQVRARCCARSPPVARSWGYLMNMGMDGFETLFAKAKAAPRDAPGPI